MSTASRSDGRQVLFALLAAVAFAAAACGPSPRSVSPLPRAHLQTDSRFAYPGSGSIPLVTAQPRPDCIVLGIVIGEPVPSTSAPDNGVGEAIAAAQEKARMLGATHLQLGEPQLMQVDGTTAGAVVTGTAYRCPRVQPP